MVKYNVRTGICVMCIYYVSIPMCIISKYGIPKKNKLKLIDIPILESSIDNIIHKL